MSSILVIMIQSGKNLSLNVIQQDAQEALEDQ